MNASQPAECLVLRPTLAFVDLVNALLNASITYDLLKLDATVYLLPFYEDPNFSATWLEKNYLRMFKHELSRWLRVSDSLLKQFNFFDFYVCFNFDYHNYLWFSNRQEKISARLPLHPHNHVLILKPKKAVKEWMQIALQDDEAKIALQKLSLADIGENATLVIQAFYQLEDIYPFLITHAKSIFEFELNRYCSDQKIWPNERAFGQFQNFYEIEIHTQLINLMH